VGHQITAARHQRAEHAQAVEAVLAPGRAGTAASASDPSRAGHVAMANQHARAQHAHFGARSAPPSSAMVPLSTSMKSAPVVAAVRQVAPLLTRITPMALSSVDIQIGQAQLGRAASWRSGSASSCCTDCAPMPFGPRVETL
jgi:hypothetical protein